MLLSSIYYANQTSTLFNLTELLQPSLFFHQDICLGLILHSTSSSSMTSPHYKPDRTSANYSASIIQEGSDFIIKPYALDIIWGGNSRYWLKPAEPKDPAELVQVSWLEVSGSVDLDKLKTGQEYRVSFQVSLKPGAFGWTADSPVYLMAKPGKAAAQNWKKVDLSSKKAGGEPFWIPSDPELKFKVPDKVVEGEKLQFGMYEIWKGMWKGGLIIHQVLVQTSSRAEQLALG